MADYNIDKSMQTTGGALTGISEDAQEVAAATGNAYSDIGNTPKPQYAQYDSSSVNQDLAENAQVSSGLDYVDENKSTVAGQLNSLLSQDSPYIQQARLAGERQASSRGMLNSSMAAGASQAQAIQAALPIAQQDAQTYAGAQNLQQQADYTQAQTQTEAIVSSGLSVQNAANEQIAQNIQNQFQSQMQAASESNKVLLQDMQNQHNTFIAGLDSALQQQLQTQQITAAQEESMRTQSSTILQNYQISVENLLTDPDFLDLGEDAVQNGINQLQTLARNSIMIVGATGGDAMKNTMEDILGEYLAAIDEGTDGILDTAGIGT